MPHRLKRGSPASACRFSRSKSTRRNAKGRLIYVRPTRDECEAMPACTYKTGRGCFPRKEYHSKKYRSYKTYQQRKRSRCQGLRQGECESRSPLCQWRRGGSQNRFRCYRGDRAAFEQEYNLLALPPSALTPIRLLSLSPSASIQQPLYQLEQRLKSLVSYVRQNQAAYDAGVLPVPEQRLFLAAEDELNQYVFYYAEYRDSLNLSPDVKDMLDKLYGLLAQASLSASSASGSMGATASLSPASQGSFGWSLPASPASNGSYAGGLGGPSPQSPLASPQQPLPPARLPLFAAARQRVVTNAMSAVQNISGNPQAAVAALRKAARETLLIVESMEPHVPNFDARVQQTLSMKLQYLKSAGRAALQTSTPAAIVQTASQLRSLMETLNQLIDANPIFVAPQEQPAAMSNEQAVGIVRRVASRVSVPVRRSARQASIRRKQSLRKRSK